MWSEWMERIGTYVKFLDQCSNKKDFLDLIQRYMSEDVINQMIVLSGFTKVKQIIQLKGLLILSISRLLNTILH